MPEKTQTPKEHANSFADALINDGSPTARDALKLCVQASFGAAHLLACPNRAHDALLLEYETQTPDASVPLLSALGKHYARLNLSAARAAGLSAETVWALFTLHAPAQGGEHPSNEERGEHSSIAKSQKLPSNEEHGEHSSSVGNGEHPSLAEGKAPLCSKPNPPPCRAKEEEAFFDKAKQTVCSLCDAGMLPFSSPEFKDECTAFEESGRAPLSHSEAYHKAHAPSYRVLSARAVRALNVLLRLLALPNPKNSDIARVLIIDGRAASGKTTLANDLSALTGAGVIHMDDFFLPPHLRTPERLQTPGENVHYERIETEILPYLKTAAAFSYRRFDCQTHAFSTQKRTVAASAFRILEGAYSMRFSAFADLSVFSDIDSDLQLARIRARKDDEEAFVTRWIPYEEAYFRAFSVQTRTDFTV